MLASNTMAPPSTDATTPSSMTTPTPEPVDPMGMERNVTLNEINLFQDCNTSIETQCTVTPGMGAGNNDFRLCITEFVTINRPGVKVM